MYSEINTEIVVSINSFHLKWIDVRWTIFFLIYSCVWQRISSSSTVLSLSTGLQTLWKIRPFTHLLLSMVQDYKHAMVSFLEHPTRPWPGFNGCHLSTPNNCGSFRQLMIANREFYIWIMFSALPPNEEARQTVIKELISTEVDYINSILSIVEVSYALSKVISIFIDYKVL